VDKILCVRSQRAVALDFSAAIEAIETDAFKGRTDAVLGILKELLGTFGQGDEVDLSQGEADADRVPVAPQLGHDEQPCPRCPLGVARRSRARTVRERIRRQFTSERPFRCNDCGWRGWIEPMEFRDIPPMELVAAPDLASIDSAVTPPSAARRDTFSPRNLR
jgi:hypothetical protein